MFIFTSLVPFRNGRPNDIADRITARDDGTIHFFDFFRLDLLSSLFLFHFFFRPPLLSFSGGGHAVMPSIGNISGTLDLILYYLDCSKIPYLKLLMIFLTSLPWEELKEMLARECGGAILRDSFAHAKFRSMWFRLLRIFLKLLEILLGTLIQTAVIIRFKKKNKKSWKMFGSFILLRFSRFLQRYFRSSWIFF